MKACVNEAILNKNFSNRIHNHFITETLPVVNPSLQKKVNSPDQLRKLTMGTYPQTHRRSSKAVQYGGPGGASPWRSPRRAPRRAAGGKAKIKKRLFFFSEAL